MMEQAEGLKSERAFRTSFIHKHAAAIAVLPVLLVALCFYLGSTIWSMVMSLTASKIFPDMTFVELHQYERLFHDDLWLLSLPRNQRVMIREQDLATGRVRTAAHLYGGQGTMNVPSWSPDGRTVAFVSYTYGDPAL